MPLDVQNVMTGLRDEVKSTLLFFIQSDMQIYGHVKKNTLEIFKVQGVVFPDQWIELLEP